MRESATSVRVLPLTAIKRRFTTTVVVTALLGFSACGPESSTGPAADTGVSPELLVSAANSSPWVSTVTGGGTAHFPTGIIGNVRATATLYADGTVSGSFSNHARIAPGQSTLPFDADVDWVAEATCLVTDGHWAWMSGPITRLKKEDYPPGHPGFQIGDIMMAIVNDEGRPGFFGSPFLTGTANCADMPALPPSAPGIVVNGGFQIHTR